MGKVVEEVAASLVREYLSRKGLKRTIACMDGEFPRTDSSINNRSDLRRVLCLEDLYKKNKSQEYPFRSLLEIMVKEQIERHGDAKGSLVSSRPFQFDSQSTEMHPPKGGKSFDMSSESERNNRSPLLSRDSHSSSTRVELLPDKKPTDTDSQRNRTGRMRRGVMAGPVSSSVQDGNKRRPVRKSGISLPPQSKDEVNREDKDGSDRASQANALGMTFTFTESRATALSERADKLPFHSRGHRTDRDGFEGAQRTASQAPNSLKRVIYSNCRDNSGATQRADLHMSSMVLDDVDDEEDLREVSRIPVSSISSLQLNWDKHPMDQQTATALKELLFGSAMRCFNTEWKCQSFSFSDAPGLRYGIIQKKGGPCGVLASVQACVLQKLLFEKTNTASMTHRLHFSNSARTKCLSLAAAEILWRAGDRKKATVATLSGRSHFTPAGHYKSEGVLEMVTCINVETLEELKLLLEQHIHQFESGPYGCVLLTLSVILSRSIDAVKKDMDVSTSTLIGAHGYCTQELVNLLLCGQAVSNVFNNDMTLDSGNGNGTLLKGVKSRCDIGLLSLFEHYNICKVGTYLKTPKYPIWVVCSESHFSVLFSLDEELVTAQWHEEEFDLYYYDGLANQQEPIQLTISINTAERLVPSEDADPDLVPPLELCIRTKWKGAVVNWNDTEPIL
ncbi:probable ubiquitin carboxyl-terminal hydrolase MINDY-4 [Chanos chanos]|uniref:Ubiquitin carboxyl-terminal hydrolase MINDY n=1 Tax=Chanos chanos TaxID=29144 RepID=A0A6J2W7P7_CHACN|nr:probable ubiquitin carboxyl-terminal hydrolase MINDY-4 [Chanos chanos]